MPNTIPNIACPAGQVVDIYQDQGVIDAGISVGDPINVEMSGRGRARLCVRALAPDRIDDETGFRELSTNENAINDAGDEGAFIQSDLGCTINVQAS